MARLSMATGELKKALAECDQAFKLLEKLESPVLQYQAHFLRGQIQLESGAPYEAYRAFREAREAMETLRSSLHGEELKIAFMKNKSDVYESLVDICLTVRRDAGGVEEAYGYIEEAKSRSLLDLIYKMGSGSTAAKVGKSDLVRNIGELREELNWYYHRIEHEQLRQEGQSPEKVSNLQDEVHQREHEFLRMLRETPSLEAESLGIYAPAAESIEQIRAALPADATAIEYFRVGEGLVVAVLTRTSLDIIPITLVSRVQTHLRVLQFQLAKFRLGSEYVKIFEQVLLSTIQSHLNHLYQELIAPIRDRFASGPLLIVPHDILHYIPFHAMFDGSKYLIDSHAISYAPSASIYAAGYRRQTNRDGNSLVLGVTDAATPSIPDEVQSVANALPDSELFLGESATADVLRKKGTHSRYIHIATHGYFRQDNPMFSGVKLGDSLLSLYDLYQMELPAELVTLSGCATGLNVVAAGDELLGLVRGLLSAGAQSLLLTLWDVHDRSTTEFMKKFYSHLVLGENKAVAVQRAMIELRQDYPHPYYWAPFILMGSALEAQK
jgi:CHAT domain-containing protein